MTKKFVITVLSSLVVLTVCGYLFYYNHAANKLSIVNNSAMPLTDVKVMAAGQKVWGGEIAPLQAASATFLADRDGSIQIVSEWNGEKIISNPDFF